MRVVNSFNELLDTPPRGGVSAMSCFNSPELDQTLQSMDRAYEILKGGLRGVYETQQDIWHSRNEQEVRQAQQTYKSIRPEIDNAVDTMKAGVGEVSREIRQEGEQVKDDPKAHDRLMKKQAAIAKSFLGNTYLLGGDAFKPVELPGGTAQPKKEMPKFATKEEAMQYYAQQK